MAFVGLDHVLEPADVPFLVRAVWILERRREPLLGKRLAGDIGSLADEHVKLSLSQKVEKSGVAGDGLVVVHPTLHLRVIRVRKGHAETSDCDAGLIGEANLNDSEPFFTSPGVRESVINRRRGFVEGVAASFAGKSDVDESMISRYHFSQTCLNYGHVSMRNTGILILEVQLTTMADSKASSFVRMIIVAQRDTETQPNLWIHIQCPDAAHFGRNLGVLAQHRTAGNDRAQSITNPMGKLTQRWRPGQRE